MNDDLATLVLLYKEQLAKIRAAFMALEIDMLDLSDLENAIYKSPAEDLEAMWQRQNDEIEALRQSAPKEE